MSVGPPTLPCLELAASENRRCRHYRSVVLVEMHHVWHVPVIGSTVSQSRNHPAKVVTVHTTPVYCIYWTRFGKMDLMKDGSENVFTSCLLLPPNFLAKSIVLNKDHNTVGRSVMG